jgi:tetratricopeptide (TPR) repeat protein
LYCAVRGFEAMDAAGQRARPVGVRWGVAAALCCAAGMATKPVMATAPVMVLALDYLFFSLSWKQALRRRWVLYAGLAATWLVLLPTTVMQSHESSAGFGYRAITPWEYACTQPRAVLWYVRLALWPDALCFDYMRPPLREWGRVIVPAAAVVLALGVTVWLLARRRPAAMFGVWFFLILSVTSSVMPIADVCVEHRVYLSLAAIIAAAVIGGYEAGGWLLRRVARRPESRARWGRALAWGAVALAAVALGWRTHERNRDYRSEAALWESVLRARPDNLRAKLNYGYALFVEGRTEEAIGMTQAPAQAGDPAAHLNLGRFYSASGRAREAEAAYRKALELDPGFAKAHYNLGNLLLQQGRVPEAAGEFAVAARLRPEWAAAHNNLGIALARMNDLKGAEERFRRALALDPGYAAARENLARVLGLTGRGAAPGSGQ